ncbi:MAG: DNA polymerase/3'-5' exonuclease PolX [Isosphaeraceae bacterium]|nr:DNA polymerase/3'-5' exonuclease PolX [Isosphaeraceae bacterium]
METARIARILDEMGTLLEVRGENPFRCRAYHNAASALAALPSDLRPMIADGSLAQVAGIGETMYAKIAQLATSGQLPAFDDLKRSTPPGLVALLRVPGLGPKKIKLLHDELKIESLADLRGAGESGRIAALKGFGAKTQTKILEGIAFIESVGERILLDRARELAEPLLAAIRSHPAVIRAEICGSVRRRAETIGDLDLLFSSDDPAPVFEAFLALPEIARVIAHGPTKVSVNLSDGVQCDVRGVTDAQFPFALHYFTGSKNHNIAMRRRAIERGLKLNEYALEGEGRSVACRDEVELFRALDLAYIPPELREDLGEVDLAERGAIPDLATMADVVGVYHNHTDWSDGGHTLAEMAAAARERGLAYLGIADHSRSAGYAGGLSIERVREQWAAIDRLNAEFAGEFRLFKGTECDILGDGSLDYPDEILAGFDYVVASVHSLFGLTREEMTARIVRAVEHPMTTMLGHPTGRLLLTRDSYAVDLDAVLAAAARTGTMIEINANPHRLDLDWIHVRKARALGVEIVINPDAHSKNGLDHTMFGVDVARRAGMRGDELFNRLEVGEAEERLKRRKGTPSR